MISQEDKALPPVLIKYQRKLLKMTAANSVVFCEKSRRIGMTWGVGSDAVLTAGARKSARGMDVFYIGFNLDMTKEFIDVCAMWAKAFSHACGEVEEFLFKDDNDKEIQAFRIKFDSGFEICALTSRPRSLRGRQGYVIIDEAAFHDDLKELMKAALAMLIWGGKVLVISTHDGVNNPFNQYIKDARAGRNKYAVLKVDFNDALKDGLFERICFTKGEVYTKEAEAAWAKEIIDFYGEGADEELFCIPSLSAGTFLPGVLVESRMEDVPVLRYECDQKFVLRPDFERERDVTDWCEENLKPLLSNLDPNLKSVFGEDFGRSGDLTILWPAQIMQNLLRRTPFTVELRNVPFQQQRQIVWYILDRLPRFTAGAFDARGNGQQLAEETMQRYGSGRIFQVMISRAWYLDAFSKYKGALEDAMMTLPKDADVLNDHRLAVVEKGIPTIPESRTKGKDKGNRHGDSLVAAAMCYWASLQDTMEYGYTSLTSGRETSTLRRDDSDDDMPTRSKSFGNSQGAW
jgi:phage FluMu gp28-like protein